MRFSLHASRLEMALWALWACCRIFTLAKERNLDLDFHVDENGNERAKGLLYIARKTIQHGYHGRVVCGHCWYAALGPAFHHCRYQAVVELDT